MTMTEDFEEDDEFGDLPIRRNRTRYWTVADWDPDEPMYADQWMKSKAPTIPTSKAKNGSSGLEPGERLLDDSPNPPPSENGKKNSTRDLPDERPRELDWSNRDDRDGPLNADDIPF